MIGWMVGVVEFLCTLSVVVVVALGGFVGCITIGEKIGSIFGALLGASLSFVACSLLYAPFIILLRIDKNITALRNHLVKDDGIDSRRL
jgi:hypothetical protein